MSNYSFFQSVCGAGIMAEEEKAQSADQADAPAPKQSTESGSHISQRTTKYAAALSHLRPVGHLVMVVLACTALAFALLWLLDKVVYYYLARSYVDQVAQAFDLSPHLGPVLN
jgi:hypothetical protein